MCTDHAYHLKVWLNMSRDAPIVKYWVFTNTDFFRIRN